MESSALRNCRRLFRRTNLSAMGNIVGSLKGQAIRKARRFNVESRTENFLVKNVKNPPPKPLATQKEIEILRKEMPDLMAELVKPNPELLDRLKDVYVSSTDKPTEKPQHNDSSRPLPLERKTVSLEYGYVEPESVTPGRLSLRQALALLSKYQRDKKVNDIEALALEYNLRRDDVEHVVEYFKLYTLVDSDQKTSGFDASPMVQDPTENIPINAITAHKYLELMSKKTRSNMKSEEKADGNSGKETEKK